MRNVAAVIVSFLLCGLCLAESPRYRHAPVRTTYAPYRHREILIAEAAFLLFDYHARDVWHFSGPLPAAAPGVSLGVDGRGGEVRSLPPLVSQEDDDRRIVSGYEDGRQVQPRAAARLASLTPACASCHTGSKSKGGFVLFDAPGRLAGSVDWKAIRAEVESGRMPPPTSGKPQVSAEDRREIVRLAGG